MFIMHRMQIKSLKLLGYRDPPPAAKPGQHGNGHATNGASNGVAREPATAAAA